MTLNVLFTIVIVTCVIHVAKLQEPADDESDSPYQQAAVATDVSQCSTMAKNILRQGGSAVDAAITAALCIGVVNPQSSGLGGGFNMVVYTHKTRKAEALIATERAPGAATEDMFPDKKSSKYDIKSIAVPGEVLGLWEAHKKYGKLPWAALFCPIIQIAEEGFQVTSHLPYVLKKPELVADFSWIREMYKPDDGTELKAGDTLSSPRELVKTLKKIAIYGPAVFYNGSVTRDMLQDMKEAGGIFTSEDFSAFKVEWLPVSFTSFKNGLQMYSPPLPSSGPTLQYILSILDEFDITDEDFTNDDRKLLLYHRYLEAGKFAFALRYHLGDDLESELVQKILSAFASKNFAKETASLIDDTQVTHSTQYGYDISDDISKMMGNCNHEIKDTEGDDGDTAHVNVEAEDGDVVSTRDEEESSGDSAYINVVAENRDAVSARDEGDRGDTAHIINVVAENGDSVSLRDTDEGNSEDTEHIINAVADNGDTVSPRDDEESNGDTAYINVVAENGDTVYTKNEEERSGDTAYINVVAENGDAVSARDEGDRGDTAPIINVVAENVDSVSLRDTDEENSGDTAHIINAVADNGDMVSTKNEEERSGDTAYINVVAENEDALAAREGGDSGGTVHIDVEAENGDAVSVRDEEKNTGETEHINEVAENGDAVSARGVDSGDTVHINVVAGNGDTVSARDEKETTGDTTQISVLAENGDAVSVTHSVGKYFGSRFYSKRTGFWFNNHMNVFYFPGCYNASTSIWKWPGAANSIAPFKRYMTYVSPSIITDDNGNVKMVVGAAGGPRITPTNTWVILRTLWMGSSLKEAIDEKRIYNYLIGSNSTYYEPGFPQELLDGLNAMGHYPKIRKSPYNYAVPNAILRLDDGTLDAYSDPRKGGDVDGY